MILIYFSLFSFFLIALLSTVVRAGNGTTLHYSCLEKSHGRRSLVGCSSWGHERLHFRFSLSCTGEGNGNPLQCSCLENPRDRGAWRASAYGVAQSRTRLKRLSSSSSRLVADSGDSDGSWICVQVPALPLRPRENDLPFFDALFLDHYTGNNKYLT